MEQVSEWFGLIGPALFLCGIGVIREHRKTTRLAAAGDEKAAARLEKWRTTEALLGPVLIVIAICMTLVTFLADYKEATSSPGLDKAFQQLQKALPK